MADNLSLACTHTRKYLHDQRILAALCPFDCRRKFKPQKQNINNILAGPSPISSRHRTLPITHQTMRRIKIATRRLHPQLLKTCVPSCAHQGQHSACCFALAAECASAAWKSISAHATATLTHLPSPIANTKRTRIGSLCRRQANHEQGKTQNKTTNNF